MPLLATTQRQVNSQMPIDSENVYKSELATVWAACSPQHDGALTYFTNFIQTHGEPAIEIGSGAGRLLIPLREAGFDVDGLEPSADMRAICENRLRQALVASTTLRRERLSDFKTRRRYSVIFASRGVFQMITDRVEISDSIGRLRACVSSTGRIALWFVAMNQERDSQPTGWLPLYLDLASDARSPHRYLWRRVSVSRGIEITKVAINEEKVREVAEIKTKRYLPAMAKQLFENHGFSVQIDHASEYGSFNADVRDDFILVGRRRN
jgi:hypothetical protein